MFNKHIAGDHTVLQHAPPHPSTVVETHAMAASCRPPLWYEPVNVEGLSVVQLEALILACQCHDTFLSGTHIRSGFCLGDGTGVGKGRVLAGLFLEYWRRSKETMRGVWVSVSSDLYHQAVDDMRSVGGTKVPFSNALSSHGLIFSTYTALERDRTLELLTQWLQAVPDPVLLLDESQPFLTGKIAKNILRLQQACPGARVVYSSATGATSVRSVLHMIRLGLWGPGSLCATAHQFECTLARAGLGAMEMLAVELRQRGVYVARQLDMSSVKFEVEICRLTEGERALYDRCAAVWQQLDNRDAHEIFFRTFLAAAKVRRALQIAQDHLHRGYSVVFALQGEGGEGVSSSSGYHNVRLGDLLKRMLLPCRSPNRPALEIEVAQLCQDLPLDPLNEIVLHFGEAQVAEMTGRLYRLQRRSQTPGSYEFERRSATNLQEQQAFTEGRKCIAVVSEASDLSLHVRHPSKRRLQIMLEMPWSPTVFVQQCARVHRSTQQTKIVVLTTDIPCEMCSTAIAYRDRRTVHVGTEALGVARNGMHQVLEGVMLRHLATLTNTSPVPVRRHLFRTWKKESSPHATLVLSLCRLLPYNPCGKTSWAQARAFGPQTEFRTRNPDRPVFGDVMVVRLPPPMVSAAMVEFALMQPNQRPNRLNLAEYTRLRTRTVTISPEEARLRWDQETYHAYLAACFREAGGHLPPLRWTPQTHALFPVQFRRAAGLLERTLLPLPVRAAVCEYLCGWYDELPLAALQAVGLLRRSPHATTLEMAFNSMLGCNLSTQRTFFHRFDDACAEQQPDMDNVHYESLELLRKDVLVGGEAAWLTLFRATPPDRTLPWERVRQLIDGSCGAASFCRQRRSRRLALCLDGARLWSITGARPPVCVDLYRSISDEEAAECWEKERKPSRPANVLLLSGALLQWWKQVYDLALQQMPPVALRILRISDGQHHHTGLCIPPTLESKVRCLVTNIMRAEPRELRLRQRGEQSQARIAALAAVLDEST